jgi:hypothetical protein
MSLNNFNEKLHDLHETLRILHKKSLQDNGLSSIDREVIKFKIVQFYEDFFVRSMVEANPPVATTISALPESPLAETKTVLPTNAAAVEVDIPTPLSKSTPEPIAAPIEKEAIPVTAETEEIKATPIFKSSTLDSIESPIGAAVFNEPTMTPTETSPSNNTAAKGLNDRFSHVAVNQSLNERFKSQTSSPISEKFASQTKSMTDLIDLNKRMLFVTQLFNSNHELYQQVLKHIDTLPTANDAVLFMEHNKPKLQLDAQKEEIYAHFLAIVQQKF